jgi:hypothetical protein
MRTAVRRVSLIASLLALIAASFGAFAATLYVVGTGDEADSTTIRLGIVVLSLATLGVWIFYRSGLPDPDLYLIVSACVFVPIVGFLGIGLEIAVIELGKELADSLGFRQPVSGSLDVILIQVLRDLGLLLFFLGGTILGWRLAVVNARQLALMLMHEKAPVAGSSNIRDKQSI